MNAEPSRELVLIEALTPAVVFADGGGGIDDILAKLRAEAARAPNDISTKAGRAEITSFAFKFARSKTALDNMGKELVAETKRRTSAIDAERRRLWEEVEALQAQVRKPLTDWENAEKDRIAEHEAAIAAIERVGSFLVTEPGSIEIQARIDFLGEPDTRDWQEFGKRAADTRAAMLLGLGSMLRIAQTREAERAELERLRQEEIARQQRERDEKIAAEAAERARIEAEAKAKQEAVAEAERVREAQAKAEREKAEANERAAKAERETAEIQQKAERDRVAAHERAIASVNGMVADACSPFNDSNLIRHITSIFDQMSELTRDWEEFADRAATAIAEGRKKIAARLTEVEGREEASRQEALEAADLAHKAELLAAAQRDRGAADKAERDRQAAITAERQRIADEQATTQAEARKREANKAHRAKINGEVLAALMGCGLTEEIGKLVVVSIARGTVPHTAISY